MTTDTIDIELDIAVIGGGIAGLWLLRRLADRGYHCALFEKAALGSGQTLASQGMIHGGIKYTLSGKLTGASETVADMPAYWRQCLAGTGEVDLRAAKTLSETFYFWSSDGVGSRMTTFFASKAVQGRVQKLTPDTYPSLLADSGFNGQVYRLQDIVMDTPSVLEALRAPVMDRLFLLPPEHGWSRDGEGNAQLTLYIGERTLNIRARQFVFTAGKGNGALLDTLNIPKPAMQLRPLHQIWLKHDLPHWFFGHCLGSDSTPRLSISTHPASDGRYVWSLGGSLAERGVNLSPEALVREAQGELKTLLPWINLTNAQWLPVRIDRAEAKQNNFLRPDTAFVKPATGINNVLVAWPTKLTLAPNLANEALQVLNKQNLTPQTGDLSPLRPHLQSPPMALPPWETADEVIP